MPDITIGTVDNINVARLRSAAKNNGYIYRDGRQIKLSKRPIGGWFFGYGTSRKHRRGLEAVRKFAAQRYGAVIGVYKRNLFDAKSLHQSIQLAKQKNQQEYKAFFDKLKNSAQGGRDPGEAEFARRQLIGNVVKGTKATVAQYERLKEQLANRAERQKFGQHLAHSYGDAALATYQQGIAGAMQRGDALLDSERAAWSGHFAAKAEADAVATRVRDAFGGGNNASAQAARQAAKQVLKAKVDALKPPSNDVPTSLLDGLPQLPKAWINEAIDAAHRAAVKQLKDTSAQRIVQANDLNAFGREQLALASANHAKQLLLQKEPLAQQVERTLIKSLSNSANAPGAQKLFSGDPDFPDDQLFALSETIGQIDQESFRSRATAHAKGVANSDQALNRVDQEFVKARQVAQLALQLRDAGVPEAEAALIVRMELIERAAGRGNQHSERWSPAVGNDLNATKQLAHKVLGMQQNAALKPPEKSAAYITLVLAAEFDERANGTPPDNRAELSERVTRMLGRKGQDLSGLKYFIGKGVAPQQVVELLRKTDPAGIGIRNHEAVACIRLGINPAKLGDVTETLKEEKRSHVDQYTYQIIKAYQDAGFNRAETLAYMREFADLNEINKIKRFAGSYLSPAQIKACRQAGIPGHLARWTRDILPRNRVAAPTPIGLGFFSKIYGTAHRTLTGIELRAFKPFRSREVRNGIVSFTPADALRKNIAGGVVAEEIGFDVAVRSEVGFEEINGQLQVGISMSLAPGKTAHHWRRIQKRAVTPDSEYGAILKYKNELRTSERLRAGIAKRYNLTSVYVDDKNRLMIEGRFLKKSQNDPVLQRRIVELEILGYVINNGDVNNGNYLISYTPDGHVAGVKGIDMDLAFGAFGVAPPLPALVDKDQYDKIMALDADELIGKVKGLLTSNDEQSIRQRVANLKRHVQELNTRVPSLVIPPSEWGKPWVTELLQNHSGSLLHQIFR